MGIDAERRAAERRVKFREGMFNERARRPPTKTPRGSFATSRRASSGRELIR
jgi:hypothetical protein